MFIPILQARHLLQLYVPTLVSTTSYMLHVTGEVRGCLRGFEPRVNSQKKARNTPAGQVSVPAGRLRVYVETHDVTRDVHDVTRGLHYCTR